MTSLGNRIIFAAFIIFGLLTLIAGLCGCEAHQPAQSAAEVQAQQWRDINDQQAKLTEEYRKLICLRASAGDILAMIVQANLHYVCKSAE